MLKYIAISTLVVCTTLSSAFAQEALSAHRAVVTDPSASNPAAPVPGKNSFTKSEAKARIEKNGYTQVSSLTQDANSIWHGVAMKNGTTVNLSLDYQGNITEQ